MAGAVAALFVIVALGVEAEPPSTVPVVLTWDAPPECPNLDALEAEIGRLAGPTATPPVKPAARATVRRGHSDIWQLTLVTQAGAFSGERKLAAASCGELMQATALVVALMINPAAGAAPGPPAVISAPPPPPPPLPAPQLRRFAVGADVVVGTGALPGAAAGAGLRLTAGGAHFQAVLRGTAWATRRAASPSDASAGGSFDLLDVGLGACARAWRGRRVSPGLCAGAALLRTHATGFGVTNPGQATAWWNAAFLGGDVRVMLTPRNGLHLGLEALVSGGRPTFGLAGVGSVYRPAPIAARGSVGWEVDF